MNSVIYARVSSQGDRQNTDRQLADLSMHAARMGYVICGFFEEHISGARRNQERPVLQECLAFSKANKIDILLVSELSRLGRNAMEVLATVKELQDCKINLYVQKEQFTLLDESGKPSLFAPVMIATLATCAELERENIQYRLQSGYKRYREQGGQVGRKKGSIKTKEQLEKEYRQVLKELRSGLSIAKTAKLCDTSTATVARLKKTFGL